MGDTHEKHERLRELRACVVHDVVSVLVCIHRVVAVAADLRLGDAHVAVCTKARGEALRNRARTTARNLTWTERPGE